MKTKLAVFLIIVVVVTLAIASVWNDSFIVDEIPHIGAGYSYVTRGDFRLNPEHPPLAKDLAGFALNFLSLHQSAFETKFWKQDINGQWEFGRNLIYNSGNDAVLMTRVAKLPMLLFFILSAIIIFHWTDKLYKSKSAALLALFLFSFSPTVIAHSRFVTTDMAALFGVLLATYFFVRFLERQEKVSFVLAFVAFGIAQLTKFSVFLLNPLFIILAVIWGLAQEDKLYSTAKTLAATIGIIILGYLAIVWPWYGWHVRNYPVERQKTDTVQLLSTYGNRLVADNVILLSDKPYIRGMAQYGLGLLMVTQRSTGGNTAYFLGEIKNTAWKKYFPVVYFIKEPLAFWLLAFIVIMFLMNHYRTLFYANAENRVGREKIRSWSRDHFAELAMLIWLAIYWYSSIKANLNIGVRHLLPTYGFVYILVSGQIINLGRKIWKRYGDKAHILYDVVICALLIWYLIENLLVFPYYLTYFNQTVGGSSNGYKYVVDSNLDWGQDLKRLADWVKVNNIEKINLDYFGWADPRYYLEDKFIWATSTKWHSVEDFLRDYPEGGYLAVSATFYMNSREKVSTSYAWLDSYKPVAVIGNSIFIWYLQ